MNHLKPAKNLVRHRDYCPTRVIEWDELMSPTLAYFESLRRRQNFILKGEINGTYLYLPDWGDFHKVDGDGPDVIFDNVLTGMIDQGRVSLWSEVAV